MTRKYVDMKRRIAYVDQCGKWIQVDHFGEAVKISTSTAGPPILSMKQAQKIAERILQWCDDTETPDDP